MSKNILKELESRKEELEYTYVKIGENYYWLDDEELYTLESWRCEFSNPPLIYFQNHEHKQKVYC